MAFPTIEAIVEDNGTSAVTSHVVSLPTGITAGDLLLVIIGCTSAGTYSALSGWTEVIDENISIGIHILGRTADGTEGADITLTNTTNTKFASIAYRISGAADIGVTPPTIVTPASGTSNAPNPPNCNPGVAKDYVWITLFVQAGEEADDDTWVNSVPTNFSAASQKTTDVAGAASVNCSLATASQLLNASSMDTVWPAGATDQSLAWRATTLAVHPAGPAAPPFPRRAVHQAIRPAPHQLEVPQFHVVQ